MVFVVLIFFFVAKMLHITMTYFLRTLCFAGGGGGGGGGKGSVGMKITRSNSV